MNDKETLCRCGHKQSTHEFIDERHKGHIVGLDGAMCLHFVPVEVPLPTLLPRLALGVRADA